MKIPKKIRDIIGDRDYVVNNVGMSNSQVICFDDMILKIQKQSVEATQEYEMTKWLDGKVLVPKVLSFECIDEINYLLMSRIKGDMLCAPVYMNNPKQQTKILCQAIKMMWEVHICDCPYNNCIDNKLILAENLVNLGLCDMERAQKDTYGENGFKSPADLLKWLKQNKPKEDLVFSHGDFCLPNIFAQNSKVTGFIDLGRGGIADKYQDIALCYRSLKNNFNGTYGKAYDGFDENSIFEELGINPDYEKLRYYILLDELF